MTDQILRLVARHLPGYEIRTITGLGGGLDNIAYELNGEMVVRQRRDDDPASRSEATRREAALLAVVSELSPLPVPRPIFVDEDEGVLAYAKVPGLPLNLNPVPEPAQLAAPLGAFLNRLHTAPAERVAALVPRDAYSLEELREEAERDYRDIVPHIPVPSRRHVEDFLARTAPREPDTLTFCHNDLGSEHILVNAETSTITGVIDWSDAAIADPAHDLALIFRDLGPEIFDLTLAHYEGPFDVTAHERALFYARCALLEDIAYGLRTGGRQYSDAGLAHLDRTFS
ncbi:phosphotransferase family protein [Acrocarpospora catenulata]|uniref:phosphotransferase family protein n=1 Tax=Acrocarpospora catenulata TaxID=2836182 RepID=UPI001BDA0779|nr:phosphotransferase [Acrocarpospora catenulata]